MQAHPHDGLMATRARAITTMMSVATFERDLRFDDAAALEARLREEANSIDADGCWLIAWFDHRVFIDAVAPGRPPAARDLAPTWLLELRLFGLRGEWRAWRNGDAFDARRRLDGTGSECEALEDDQSLWGTTVRANGHGGTVLAEARGISYTVPLLVEESDLPLRLRTRQYLAYDDDGMVGVADARLVELCRWDGGAFAPPKRVEREG